MMTGMARLAVWLRLAALLGTAAIGMAAVTNAAAGANRPEPEIAQAKGEKCIKDDAYMIRHHMDMLKHQRDDTMRRGIRSGDASLKRCMECHAGEHIAGGKTKTDCDSCHAYAAVKLDCWDCHAKQAAKPKQTPAQASQTSPMLPAVQPEGQTK